MERHARKLLLGSALLIGLALPPLARPVLADSPEDAANPYAWEAPPAEQQLAQDQTPVPAGKGAVFAPALTLDGTESAIEVVDGEGRVVASGRTGERIVLPPGDYTVLAGPVAEHAVRVPVHVEEGRTTLVPVRWTALRVEVVDRNLVPQRTSYELIQMASREVFGTGFGADTLQGEKLEVWLLPPGLYRIVQAGSDFRARENFASVYLPEGGLVRFRLVVDPETGDFLGAGVVAPGEFGSPISAEGSAWTHYLVLGTDANLAQDRNVVGSSDKLHLGAAFFAEGYVAYRRDQHFFSALGEVDEGFARTWTGADYTPLPLVKTDDRLRLDALYTYLLSEKVGPYVRVAGQTQAFATDELAAEDLTVVYEEADGTTRSEEVAANETYRIAEAWDDTILREGAGVNAQLWNDRRVSLSLRAGLGTRQNLYGGVYVLDDDPDTEELEYRQVESYSELGLEGTVRGIFRLTGSLVYATDLELFGDFDTLGEPTFEWENDLTLRLTRYFSLNYGLNLSRTPQVTDALQLEQSLLLRASVDVF